jgi:hypothetical protein
MVIKLREKLVPALGFKDSYLYLLLKCSWSFSDPERVYFVLWLKCQ